MKEKIQIQKGFIKIPLLAIIMVFVVAVGGIGYGISEYHSISKTVERAEELTREERYNEAIEKLEFAQGSWLTKYLRIRKQEITNLIEKNKTLLEDQLEYVQGIEEFNKGNWEKAKELLLQVSEASPHYQDARNKIEKSQREIIEKQIITEVERGRKELREKIREAEELAKEAQRKVEQEETKRRALEAQIERTTITSAEMQPYLTGTGRIDCVGDLGGFSVCSASLWKFDEPLGYSVLTNEHCIISNNCMLSISNGKLEGTRFWLNPDRRTYNWRNGTDVAIVPILHDFIWGHPPINLNYSIGKLRHCLPKMPLNSPVRVIGYPAFTHMRVEEGGIVATRTITEGIISSYEVTLKNKYKLPHVNYFISAKIDSGNSGGIALSKDEHGLCILGIPTWLNIGGFETQGIIQNIHNLL